MTESAAAARRDEMEALFFLTELIGLKVYDVRGRRMGRIRDAAIVPMVDPRRVDRFLVGGGWAWLTIRFDQVRSIGLDGLHLRDEQLTPYHDDENMLRLVQDLLDQQIIDVQGRKVVRVTDLTFELRHVNGHDELFLRDVDIGLRSVFRRLAQGVVPPRLVRRLQSPIAPLSIDWSFCNIVEPDPQRRLRLRISMKSLEQLHPADLADIVEDLGPDDREAIFETIDEEVAAEALSEVDLGLQASILESLEPEKAADIVEEMPPDEAADVLQELEEDTAGEILAEMEPESTSEVRELLEFPERSAGGLMTTERIELPDSAMAADALAALRGDVEIAEELQAIFLYDPGGRLSGVVPVVRLLLADPSAPLATLASPSLQAVPVGETRDRVIDLFDKYNLWVLPVVDDDGRLAGVITADDVISVLAR